MIPNQSQARPHISYRKHHLLHLLKYIHNQELSCNLYIQDSRCPPHHIPLKILRRNFRIFRILTRLNIHKWLRQSEDSWNRILYRFLGFRHNCSSSILCNTNQGIWKWRFKNLWYSSSLSKLPSIFHWKQTHFNLQFLFCWNQFQGLIY